MVVGGTLYLIDYFNSVHHNDLDYFQRRIPLERISSCFYLDILCGQCKQIRRPMGKLNRRKVYTSLWELITSTGDDICFVCDKKFRKGRINKVYVGKSRIIGDNNSLYRHTRCDSLSENWKNKFGKVNHKT